MNTFAARATSVQAADQSRAQKFLTYWKQKLKETPGCPYATRMIKRYSEQLKQQPKG